MNFSIIFFILKTFQGQKRHDTGKCVNDVILFRESVTQPIIKIIIFVL